MNEGIKQLSVHDIDGGDLLRQADVEIGKIVRDIMDVNKKAEAKRSVKIELTFAPSKSRREAEVEYKVTSVVAPHPSRKSQIHLGKQNGQPVASAYVPNEAIQDMSGDGINI